MRFRRIGAVATALLTVAIIAGCGSSSSSSTSSTSSAASSGKAATVAISATAFTPNFAAMKQLTSVVAAGKGKIAALLPDTVSSTRYVEFDAPYIKQAAADAGLSASDISVQNALGSDATQLTQAQTAITNGATVLLVDPIDPGVGKSIESYATAHGVPTIDYDRLTLGGSRKYYVSFDNVRVGRTMGTGFVACVKAWKVAKPQVVVMHGATTDNNATLFYTGYYNQVLQPLFKSGAYVDVVNPPGTWDPPTALTSFEAAYTAHKSVNAALIPNDENAAPIINYLKTQGIKPDTFPTSGQDATLTGLQNILSGYQCGTVYKPIYLEAQAAVALAVYLRAGQTPPTALVNGTTQDTTANVPVPSVLLVPEWVTPVNMNATVIADKFVPASQLCTGTYAAQCTKYGIKP